jgi:hypothetical protein
MLPQKISIVIQKGPAFLDLILETFLPNVDN